MVLNIRDRKNRVQKTWVPPRNALGELHVYPWRSYKLCIKYLLPLGHVALNDQKNQIQNEYPNERKDTYI